jgi:glycosyltransferase involved in cell wall biosynthesis
MPQLSVIIPVYNREKFLPQTLDSLLEQSSPDWEAILVDDHSTDRSWQIAQQYAGKDRRFRLFRRQASAKGASVCRNEGIVHASHEYLIFLDSDDALAPHCIQSRLEYMSKHMALDFAAFYTYLFRNTPGDMQLLWNVKTHENDLDRFLNLDIPWNTSAVIWKRQALEKINNWDPRLKSWQDWDLHIKALIDSLSYHFVAAPPDSYWRVPTQHTIGSHSLSRAHWESHKYLLLSTQERIQSAGLMNTRREKQLVGIYFWIAKISVINRDYKTALEVWQCAAARGLLSCTNHRLGKAYLQGRSFHPILKYPLEIMLRIFWGRDMRKKVSKTYRTLVYQEGAIRKKDQG